MKNFHSSLCKIQRQNDQTTTTSMDNLELISVCFEPSAPYELNELRIPCIHTLAYGAWRTRKFTHYACPMRMCCPVHPCRRKIYQRGKVSIRYSKLPKCRGAILEIARLIFVFENIVLYCEKSNKFIYKQFGLFYMFVSEVHQILFSKFGKW